MIGGFSLHFQAQRAQAFLPPMPNEEFSLASFICKESAFGFAYLDGDGTLFIMNDVWFHANQREKLAKRNKEFTNAFNL